MGRLGGRGSFRKRVKRQEIGLRSWHRKSLMQVLDVDAAAGVNTSWVSETPWEHWSCNEEGLSDSSVSAVGSRVGSCRPWRQGGLCLLAKNNGKCLLQLFEMKYQLKRCLFSYQYISAQWGKPKEPTWVIRLCFVHLPNSRRYLYILISTSASFLP